MALPLLTAVTGAWEAPLVSALERSSDVVVVRRCADLPELLAAAEAGLGRAALVSADLARLDRGSLERLAATGVAVVGVTAVAGSPDEPERARRLLALGVRAQVAADADGPAVVAAVTAAVAAATAAQTGSQAGSQAVSQPGATGVSGLAPAPAPGPADGTGDGPPEDRVAAGQLVVVWGAPGAPGRTTVAVNLAAELAACGRTTLLADADTWSASVAQVLGLLDESAGVAAACRAAASGALTAEGLHRLAPQALPGLRVLTGLPRSSRWPEVGGAALRGVWETGRAVAEWTVVDVGSSLEQDEELTFDTSAPRRNAAALVSLEAADTVVVVGSADPVGLQRLVRALQDLVEAVPTARPLVVVTRVRASAVGPSPRRRVAEALARYAGVHDPVLVPDDRGACDAALLGGRTLAEVAPSSPARAALRSLAEHLVSAQEAAERLRADAAGDVRGVPPGAGGRRRRAPARTRSRRRERGWARMHR